MPHSIAWVIAYDIWNCTHCIVTSCLSVCMTVAFSPFTFSISPLVPSQDRTFGLASAKRFKKLQLAERSLVRVVSWLESGGIVESRMSEKGLSSTSLSLERSRLQVSTLAKPSTMQSWAPWLSAKRMILRFFKIFPELNRSHANIEFYQTDDMFSAFCLPMVHISLDALDPK